ncbi:MAG TPA: dephospho-CoA kinase [Candidatus Acidoferrales bacterium]|nr:dephospho-CoA kinase [Candidatus Acidoferrales bacterium]
MRLIGLTGGIATGKSTVDAMLAARGATVIDADALAREAVVPGEPTLERVVQRFGSDILLPDGSLDRQQLGAIVFADPTARHDLERITHPRIIELSQQRIAAGLASDAPLVSVDIPLLYEGERESTFPGVLVVYAPPEVQIQRLRERNGLDDAAARQRLDAQMPIDEKRRRATWVIDNSGDLEATERQVDAWWTAVVSPAP